MAQGAQETEIKPATGGVGLLFVDMVNPMDFEGAEALLPHATAAAETIFRIRDEADRRGLPVVYVNDNFGQWHSERALIVEHALHGRGRKHCPPTRAPAG